MKKLCFAAAVILTMAGCASKPPISRGIFLEYETGAITPNTPTGRAVVAELGTPIWQSGSRQLQIRRTARLATPVNAELEVGHRLSLRSDIGYTLKRRSFNGNAAVCGPTSGPGNVALVATAGGRAQACVIDQDGDGTFDVVMFEQYEKAFPLQSKVPYAATSTESSVPLPQSVRSHLLYQGREGDVLRLSYREFTASDLARPAFTQDLTYNLSSDGTATVGFKGLRMRVISADNQQLTAVFE